MNILTVNPGSTAVKYTIFEEGVAIDTKEFSRKEMDSVQEVESEWLAGLEDVDRIGIRIVHGGSITKSREIDAEVLAEIKRARDYAPLHNSIALEVISALSELLANVPIIAVFDTEFHSTLPPHAYTYPLPTALAQELGLRRYGFHGIALKSVLDQLPAHSAERGSPIPRKIVMAHLGGGSSITAVEEGKSVDTTMGFTPLEGIMMITRSGSIDPDMARIIGKQKFLSPDDVSKMLNEQSGFYGLTGSKDTLDIITRAAVGEEPYKLAVDIFVHQIVKQIYAYHGILQGAEAIIFSGGIGYGNEYLRSRILEKTALIGLTAENTYVIQASEAKTIFDIVSNL